VSHPGHNVPFKTEFGGVELVDLPLDLGAAAEVQSVARLVARMKTQRLAGGVGRPARQTAIARSQTRRPAGPLPAAEYAGAVQGATSW
jgi:hypothetical protein